MNDFYSSFNGYFINHRHKYQIVFKLFPMPIVKPPDLKKNPLRWHHCPRQQAPQSPPVGITLPASWHYRSRQLAPLSRPAGTTVPASWHHRPR